MSRLEDAKKRYDETPIPEELSARVQAEVTRSALKRQKDRRVIRLRRMIQISGRCAAAAAALVFVFAAALNTNTAFAEMAAKLPVIGTVARVLTVRSYGKDKGDWKISVKIPSVEMIAEDTNGLDDALNREIYDMCSQYAKQAEERVLEYKKAFMETGGTEEEWKAHHIEIRVDYEIKSHTADYLSFVVRGTENFTSGGSESRYYSIDLKRRQPATLRTVLGENYVQIANESIKAKMKAMEDEGGIEFWSPEQGGFTGITDSTRFYMNDRGNPVIVFGKYEIAPGAYGELEFEVER